MGGLIDTGELFKEGGLVTKRNWAEINKAIGKEKVLSRRGGEPRWGEICLK